MVLCGIASYYITTKCLPSAVEGQSMYILLGYESELSFWRLVVSVFYFCLYFMITFLSIFLVAKSGAATKKDSLPTVRPLYPSGVRDSADVPKRPNSLNIFGKNTVRPNTLELTSDQLLNISEGGEQKQTYPDKAELEEATGTTCPLKPAAERSASYTVATETSISNAHCSMARSVSFCSPQGRVPQRTGIESGFDPLSLLAAENKTGKPAEPGEMADASGTRRHLAEEIQLHMEHLSSPVSQRSFSTDLRSIQSPSPHSSPRQTAVPGSPSTQLQPQPRSRLFSTPSLPLGCPRRSKDARPTSLASPSSPTPSVSSFSMESLLTPTLDVFRSSFMSAGKGVAEKASRLYSRLSSQTSIAQVSPHVSAVLFPFTYKLANLTSCLSLYD